MEPEILDNELNTETQNNPTKNALVFVYGPNIVEVKYSYLVDLKKLADEKGQPFILIPEPDKNGKPTIPLNSTEYNAEYVKKVMDSYFGEQGDYKNLDYTVIVEAHGAYGKKANHGTLLGKDVVYSKDLFKSLAGEGFLGTFFLPCYSGLAAVSLNEALIELKNSGCKLQEKIDFKASSSFYEESLQLDGKSLIFGLEHLIKEGVNIDAETIETEYLIRCGSTISNVGERSIDSPPITKKVFDTNNLEKDSWCIGYNDLGTKLENLYNEAKSGKVIAYELLERFSEELRLSPSDKKWIEKTISKSDSFENFVSHITEQKLYGELQFLADKYYPDIENNLELNKEIFYNKILENKDNHSRYFESGFENSILPREKSFELLVKIAQENIDELFEKHFNNLKNLLSEEQKVKLIESLISKDPDATMFHFKVWEDAFTIEQKVDLLKSSLDQDPWATTYRFDNWKDEFNTDQLKELLNIAKKEDPKAFIAFCNDQIPYEKSKEIKEILKEMKEEAKKEPFDKKNEKAPPEKGGFKFDPEMMEALRGIAYQDVKEATPQISANLEFQETIVLKNEKREKDIVLG
jgi:hypothetical protein